MGTLIGQTIYIVVYDDPLEDECFMDSAFLSIEELEDWVKDWGIPSEYTSKLKVFECTVGKLLTSKTVKRAVDVTTFV